MVYTRFYIDKFKLKIKINLINLLDPHLIANFVVFKLIIVIIIVIISFTVIYHFSWIFVSNFVNFYVVTMTMIIVIAMGFSKLIILFPKISSTLS